MTALPTLRVVFDGGQEMITTLSRMSATLRSGDLVGRMGARVAHEAERVVGALTPRLRQRSRSVSNPKTKRGFPPLFRRWETIVTDHIAGQRFRAVVQNAATNDAAGAIVLLALEGGAKPHDIDPVNAAVLAWRSPRTERRFGGRVTEGGVIKELQTTRPGTGSIVFWPGTTETGVRHPGHEPFRMVQRTVEHLDRVVPLIVRVFANEIDAMWSRLGVAGFGSFTGSTGLSPVTFNPINFGSRRSRP